MSKQLIFLFLFMYACSNMTWIQMILTFMFLFCGFLYLIYAQQESILYLNNTIPPKKTCDNPSPYANPKQNGIEYEDVWLHTSDNIKLHAWFIPYNSELLNDNNNNDTSNDSNDTNDVNIPTLIFYHANAGNMGFRLPNIIALHKSVLCNLFILSYRGYGESDGEPNEKGLMIDAKTAYEYIKNKRKCNNIYVFGRSLGGAVAIYIGCEYSNDKEFKGIIIENTFTCISDMVKKVFPFLDFYFIKKYMLKIHWKSIERINKINKKLLFIGSQNDEVVPHEQMIKLYNNATYNDKTFYKVNNATHNDAWMIGGDTYFDKIKQFIV
mmetsp:Transcript_72970/g.89501  ORF Transcript_72970/g.89501 Transcript_72970/m.89501 type:complete len:324 (+) Transcript_72970:39-1010(+)